jgi:hypothetical protein
MAAGRAKAQHRASSRLRRSPNRRAPSSCVETKRGEQFDPAKFGLGPDARFDVIVDETPSSPNQKEATWAALQPFMDKLPPQPCRSCSRYSPLPESVAKEIGDALAKAGGRSPEIPPELQQMIEQGKQRIAELEQENAQLKDKSQIDAAKVGVQQQDADTRRLKVESAWQTAFSPTTN